MADQTVFMNEEIVAAQRQAVEEGWKPKGRAPSQMAIERVLRVVWDLREGRLLADVERRRDQLQAEVEQLRQETEDLRDRVTTDEQLADLCEHIRVLTDAVSGAGWLRAAEAYRALVEFADRERY